MTTAIDIDNLVNQDPAPEIIEALRKGLTPDGIPDEMVTTLERAGYIRLTIENGKQYFTYTEAGSEILKTAAITERDRQEAEWKAGASQRRAERSALTKEHAQQLIDLGFIRTSGSRYEAHLRAGINFQAPDGRKQNYHH